MWPSKVLSFVFGQATEGRDHNERNVALEPDLMPRCRNARVPSMQPGNGSWVSRLAMKQDDVLSRLLLSTLILFLNAEPSKWN